MRHPRRTRTALGTVMLAMLVWAAVAVPVAFAGSPAFAVYQHALYAGSPQAEAHFGQAVAVSNDTIVVGEPDHEWAFPGALPFEAGAAYVYIRDGADWALQATLRAPTIHVDDKFGSSVAIDGDTIIVGAPGYTAAGVKRGAAFVYTRWEGVWSAPATLYQNAVSANGGYGSSVAVDGDTVVVGEPGAPGENGRVWPYHWSGATWVSQGALTDPTGMVGDQLGASVAIEGDTILAGAIGDTYVPPPGGTVMNAGSVQRFTRAVGQWTHRQVLFSAAPQALAQFGAPLAMSDGRAIAGAWQERVGAVKFAGAAYSFVDTGAGWVNESSFYAPVPEENGYYGSGVGLDGDTAVIGAFFSNSYKGLGFFYSRASGSWTLKQQVNLDSVSPGVVQLGTSAAIADGIAVLGGQMSFAPGVADPGAGGAYVFTAPTTLIGIVTDAATGLPVSGIEVSAYVPDGFGDPELVAIGYSAADGSYALSLPGGTFRVGWMDGTDTYYRGFYSEVDLWPDATPVSIAATTVTTIDLPIHAKPTVWMSKLTSPSSVRHARRFTVRGDLKPRHRAGSYPVKLECYRWERTRSRTWAWVLRKTVSARARDYRPRRSVRYFTRFSSTLSLPLAGSWRIRAVHAADAVYAASTSSWRYIRVR